MLEHIENLAENMFNVKGITKVKHIFIYEVVGAESTEALWGKWKRKLRKDRGVKGVRAT